MWLTPRQVAKLRTSYQAIGKAGSAMYSRGLVIPARWGYEIISMITWGRLGIDILLNEIHAWLAGAAD